VFAIIILGCLGAQYSHAQELSAPEQNFEHLWREFDQRYALFNPKRIDWYLLYEVYRPKVNSETTDDELFEIMTQMLGQLNDFHVQLISKDPQRIYGSGRATEIMQDSFDSLAELFQYFGERPLHEKYAQGGILESNSFAYAWLDNGIGYIHSNGFNDLETTTADIDGIVSYFRSAKNLIIDVRRNSGGSDRVGKAVADRFADRKRLYLITRAKNGPGHDDFAKSEKWFVEPGGEIQFTKPIILLTDLYTISAGENFALAMRVLPHVTIVGDVTAGVYADTENDTLPNGWQFRVSTSWFTDQNGFCWEGIGIPPDLRVVNTKQDLADERDQVLEFAIELINTGALQQPAKKR
jgi:C-terminal processing protease CtpA/Prc